MRKTRFTEEQMVRSSARPTSGRSRRWPRSTASASRRSTSGASGSATLEPGGREAAAAAGAGERPAEEAGRRARPRDRGHEGDHPKKMVSARGAPAAGRVRDGRAACRSRRACALLSVARSTLALSLAAGRAAMRRCSTRMRSWPAQYPRYGYRRIQIFLARDGHDDERRPRASALAAGGPAGAAEAAAPARRDRPPPAVPAHGRATRSGPTTSCSTPAPTARR